MPIKNIFSPFAQKYLLRKKYLYGKSDGIRLLHHTDLNWHWGVRDDQVYSEIKRDYEKLIQTRFEPYSIDGKCVVECQPIWDMANCMSDPKRGEEIQIRRKIQNSNFVEGKDPLTCRRWRMEHWAYYAPAHTSKVDRYGIHLTKRGIAQLAHQVHQLCPKEPLEIIQLAAAYKLYTHEMCHAWIEEICCLLDFSGGETASKLARRYTQTHKRYHGYIFMEEAICNTAAYGSLQNFLSNPAYDREPTMPTFTPKNILNAFKEVMRSQPAGYRDFQEINELPHQSETFIRNIGRLLVEIYWADCDGRNWEHSRSSHEISDVVGMFFGVDVHHFSHITLNTNSRWNSMWPGEPPLHIEN